MADKIIMAALWRDGYHAAARLIETLESSINKDAEFSYLKAFARENCFGDEVCRNQIRILWTAYCFHHDLNVDTRAYDKDLLRLWKIIAEDVIHKCWRGGYTSFSDFMCVFLV